MKLFSIICIALCVPKFVHASELIYSDKEATILKTEKIISVLVSHDPETSVLVVTETSQCHVLTKNLDEAFSIQNKLASDSKSWIQCYGKFSEFSNPARIVVETDRYTVGLRLAE